jgi:2-polyprenyl-6-methoxyphenol hydroxylase-like FAD-dependent oxidoreductase
MRVLISGAGIAGPTLAYWLLQHGFEPTLVERAPRLRTGGYVIDFWGVGYDLAERMGLLPALTTAGYRVKEVRMVGRDGQRVSGFSADVFARATNGRYLSVPRGELAACIYRAIEDRVETLLGESVTRIEENGQAARVSFDHAEPREFDLVIGADGLHSNTRRLVFGAQAQFEKYLGYKVAAFEVSGYRPRDELVYVMYTQVGQQVARFAMRDDRTMFLFVFRDREADSGGGDVLAQKARIRERFRDSGWECAKILDALDSSEGLYFDRVSQIRMDRWAKGRVCLVGDAAACVSLLAGQGSALAMVEAYVLAGELKASGGSYQKAFEKYQERLQPFLAMKQQSALRFADSFAPSSGLGLFLRNQAMKLLSVPLVADLAFGRGFNDKIDLPAY